MYFFIEHDGILAVRGGGGQNCHIVQILLYKHYNQIAYWLPQSLSFALYYNIFLLTFRGSSSCALLASSGIGLAIVPNSLLLKSRWVRVGSNALLVFNPLKALFDAKSTVLRVDYEEYLDPDLCFLVKASGVFSKKVGVSLFLESTLAIEIELGVFV